MTKDSSYDGSLKGRCHGNRFMARVGENCRTLFSFCALRSTTDGRIATWIVALTPPMNLYIL